MPEKYEFFVRNPDFIFRKVVEEAILVPLYKDMVDMDAIYSLNEVGAFLWEVLDTPKTLEDLTSEVQNEFDAEKGRLDMDIRGFLDEMENFGAVERQ